MKEKSKITRTRHSSCLINYYYYHYYEAGVCFNKLALVYLEKFLCFCLIHFGGSFGRTPSILS